MERVTVHKLDHDGREITAYPAQVLWREDTAIALQTTWERPPLDLGFVTLQTGSQWIEYFFSDRWYNIFEIHAVNGQLQGWYCNITRPACITAEKVTARDLALDLWVAGDGTMQVLDEDDFAALPLTPAERESARDALSKLRTRVMQRMPPFDQRLTHV
jgi:protein associated with RNAse G/E